MPRKKNHAKILADYFETMFVSYGPQGWWPGETPFEVIVGAILTQNTAWTNVEKAVKNLKAMGVLAPRKLHGIDTPGLARLIKPAGYFNVKARRLKNFTNHLFDNYGGRLERLLKKGPSELRGELLDINGIGPETADSIVLYAASHPEFVVDAYTKRVLERHSLIHKDATYEETKALFMDNLKKDAGMFNEYHALIVKTGKDFCRPRAPLCAECPLSIYLPKKTPKARRFAKR